MTDSTTPRDAAPDWDALARFLAGESPDAEARAVSGWLAEHPDDAALLGRLDAVASAGAAAAADVAAGVDVEGALRRVRERRDADSGATVLPFRVPERRRQAPAWRRWAIGGLAAAAAVAVVAVGLGRLGRERADAGASVAATERVYTTPVGARDSVRLPDGTRVLLAPASRLVVAAGYGDRGREVTLVGAAWFAVQHDAARPFAVHAGNAIVRDIGTAFTVRADAGPAGTASVAVTEGAVALAHAAGPPHFVEVRLAAGDRGEVRASGEVVAMRGAVTAEDTAWTRGRLVYSNTPLDVVRSDVRRWYGVDLQVADPALAGRRITATFEGDSVGDVLRVIGLALGARVERAGNVATLRPAP